MVSPRALPVAAAAAVAALIVAVADPANALVRSTNVFASNRLRSAVPDPAFVFTPGAPANLRQLPFGSLSLGAVDQHPALGGADVQMAYTVASIHPGATLPAHLHPRATELDYIVRGTIQTVIVEENGSGRSTITVKASAGQLSVIPEGLIHSQTCVSAEPCRFVATLNSADPGTLLVGSSVCALPDFQAAAALGNGFSPATARAFCAGGVL